MFAKESNVDERARVVKGFRFLVEGVERAEWVELAESFLKRGGRGDATPAEREGDGNGEMLSCSCASGVVGLGPVWPFKDLGVRPFIDCDAVGLGGRGNRGLRFRFKRGIRNRFALDIEPSLEGTGRAAP